MYGVWCCTRGLEGSVYRLYMQRKIDRRECANYRGIIRLSMPRKIYGRVLISRVMEIRKNRQRRSKEDLGLVGGVQIRYLKQLVEKYREKRKDLYVAFIDLEKAYYKICKELRSVQHECGVDGYLIRNMSSLYDGSWACIRLGNQSGGIFFGKEGVE